MATRKVTITLPEPLASQFNKMVPARDRSKYLAAALAEKLSARERQFAEACDYANRNSDVRNLERDFDALPSEITEPWSDTPKR